MTEIVGFITAAGHFTNVCKTIYQAHTQAEVNAVKIDLQEAMFDLQAKMSVIHAAYQTMAESNEGLKKKLAEYEQWDREAARYELKQLAEGIYAYALKPDQHGNEPPHLLCPHCFNERKRSILQHQHPGDAGYDCHACKMRICPEHKKHSSGFRVM